jgi:UDPglucose 6-dehydrogenase
MKITVAGSGYVGLVTGACFSDVGIEVVCVDTDLKRIADLQKGVVPIYEPGLKEMILRNMEKGRLHFIGSLQEALPGSDIIFIAVGTPPGEDGSADLSHVLEVAHACGRFMNDYLLIVTKSTVPVGTAALVKSAVAEELACRGVMFGFDVASNPEFLKEGAAIEDFMKPDRIVIGVESPKAETIMRSLYKPFTLNGHPLIFMDIPSAEMTKYAANAMLATKISFMNDIANLCEITGADVNLVRKGIGSDSRIGPKFIYPGIGYGGSCFPKDLQALIRIAREHHYELRVLQAVEAVNQDQKLVLFRKIKDYFDGNVSGKKAAIWGLSFKPHTDDMREAPSREVISKLLEAGARVSVYDPVAMGTAKRIFGSLVEYASGQYEALKDADCLALVTEWPEFRYPDFRLMRKLMAGHVIFDGRNIYDTAEMGRLGFDYYCIGVKPDRKTIT